MNECCFSIIIRQRACQNGVPITTNKLITNISEMENITLNFGYTVTLSLLGFNNILVTFNNTSLNITLKFSITNPGIGIFDLPLDGGTFRVLIMSETKCCNAVGNTNFNGWF